MGPDDLVFTSPRWSYLPSKNFRQTVWKPTLRATQIDSQLRIHDRRYSSFADDLCRCIDQGGSVTLGHASAKVTLDIYAGLFDDDLRALADRLDERIAGTDFARKELDSYLDRVEGRSDRAL
jgi:integrase